MSFTIAIIYDLNLLHFTHNLFCIYIIVIYPLSIILSPDNIYIFSLGFFHRNEKGYSRKNYS